ncbi:MAG: ATP-binding cassette domain-containing protein [Bacteroidetes bacterium]|nr:ATP-binding cassette domain-containing protein [Bacteroidota bacterium]
MQIELKNLLPIPLKEQFLQRHSDVWGKDLKLSTGDYIKCKAPSGSGKSTLVHILYKLRKDYEGDVFWDHENVKNIDAQKLAGFRQQTFSIVFQDLRLFPHLSAFENIQLNRVLQKPFYEESNIYEMADRLGVRSILSQAAGICSYGEQQRIAIIRALIQPFSWLIMDEPFSHLDQQNISKASSLIREECIKRSAGFILTDLEDDQHFNYSKKLDL